MRGREQQVYMKMFWHFDDMWLLPPRSEVRCLVLHFANAKSRTREIEHSAPECGMYQTLRCCKAVEGEPACTLTSFFVSQRKKNMELFEPEIRDLLFELFGAEAESARTLCVCAQVCKRWNSVLSRKDEYFWRPVRYGILISL